MSTNTKSRRWVFTINNPQSYELFRELPDGVDYVIWQHEQAPTTTTHHIQGYVRFRNARTMSGAKRLLGETAHVEIARGSEEECIAYCSKQESKVEGPWEFGVRALGQGKRSDLLEAAEIVKRTGSLREVRLDLIVKNFRGLNYVANMEKPRAMRNVRVLCLWGATGAGKTYIVFDKVPDVYSGFTINTQGQLWADSYEGEKTILLDDFGRNSIVIERLLKLCQGYQLKLEMKGGSVWMRHETIIINSNINPEDWYPSIAQHHMEALRRRLGLGKWKDKDHMTFEVNSREDVERAWNEFNPQDAPSRVPTPILTSPTPIPSPVLKRQNAEVITIDDD